MIKITFLGFALGLTACSLSPIKNDDNRMPNISTEELARDNNLLIAYNNGLAWVMNYIMTKPDLFRTQPQSKAFLPSQSDREEILSVWKSFLDYIIALDLMQRKHIRFYETRDAPQKEHMFMLYYTAFLTQYRYALDFIKIIQNTTIFDSILNEEVINISIQKGMYKDLKFRFLNIIQGSKFLALNSIKYYYDPTSPNPLDQYITRHRSHIWDIGKGKGELMTLENGIDIIKDAGKQLFFPAQKNVSRWMGDIKIKRSKYSLINQQQVKKIALELQPGDIMLQRREWYLSNIGLPGYWPHAALFIGRPENRREFFNDEAINQWVISKNIASGSFEELLQVSYPESYAIHQHNLDQGHSTQVLEAISEGVSFTSIEHSAAADSLAVLRPRLSKLEIAQSVYRAFSFHARPYDFDFDFLTDNTLVCTELIYKSYQPDKKYKGLRLPLTTIMGRLVTTANDIARLFDQDYGTNEQQMNFILFVDGDEKKATAKYSDVNAFRSSWTRPKWYVFLQ